MITRVCKQLINALRNFFIILQNGRVGVLRMQWESMDLTSEPKEPKGGLGHNSGADAVGTEICT